MEVTHASISGGDLIKRICEKEMHKLNPQMNKLIVLLLCISLSSCVNSKRQIDFDKHFDRAEYHTIAKAKGISNEVWINRLYNFKVNINQFDAFNAHGVNLAEVQGRGYLSRAILTDAIIEGEVISKKQNASPDVMFHTEYAVRVHDVIKAPEHQVADTILLKMMFGPVGDKYMALIAGVDKYEVGEKAIIYLEAMERTFKGYEEHGPERLARINADRSDLNIFRPLKKYLVKNGDIYERTNGKVEKKKKAVKALRKLDRLNRRF